MTRHSVADVIVVGLGAAGSALTWQLARLGVKVIGIDRFDPPHDQGSTHGHTRITRLAVGEGEAFVPLVRRSHVLWRELESSTGVPLMRQTGVLIVGAPAGDGAAFHGQAGFFARTREIAQRFGIAHQMLDAAEVRERFPAFAPAGDERSYFEPEGGVLFPEAGVRVQLMLAAQAGADIRRHCRMDRLEASGSSVAVHTDGGVLHAAHVVLCTGAWLPAQVGGAVQARLRVLRQVLHWFDVERPEWYEPASCPGFLWLHGPDPADAFYGFPRVDGQPGVKVATEQFVQTSEPDTMERTVAPDEGRRMFAAHLAGRLGGLLPRTLHDAVCAYTMAPDGNFLIDRHPLLDHVTVVSPCSGHGFKHSAALGESLAQRLAGVTPSCDLSAFATLGAR